MANLSAENFKIIEAQKNILTKQQEQLAAMEENQWRLMETLNFLRGDVYVLQSSIEKQKNTNLNSSRKSTPSLSALSASNLVDSKLATPELKTNTPKKDKVKSSQQNFDKIILGRVEWARLNLFKQKVKARIDTGASSSSLSASNIQAFERDGKNWVRFEVPVDKKSKKYELPLVRYVKIRQAAIEPDDRRPVVRMKVQVGDIIDETDFTLTNREKMLYPVLLGRSFLKDIVIVDVSKRFTQKQKSLSKSKVKVKVKNKRKQKQARSDGN